MGVSLLSVVMPGLAPGIPLGARGARLIAMAG
jgi:hypothetical protein